MAKKETVRLNAAVVAARDDLFATLRQAGHDEAIGSDKASNAFASVLIGIAKASDEGIPGIVWPEGWNKNAPGNAEETPGSVAYAQFVAGAEEAVAEDGVKWKPSCSEADGVKAINQASRFGKVFGKAGVELLGKVEDIRETVTNKNAMGQSRWKALSKVATMAKQLGKLPTHKAIKEALTKAATVEKTIEQKLVAKVKALDTEDYRGVDEKIGKLIGQLVKAVAPYDQNNEPAEADEDDKAEAKAAPKTTGRRPMSAKARKVAKAAAKAKEAEAA